MRTVTMLVLCFSFAMGIAPCSKSEDNKPAKDENHPVSDAPSADSELPPPPPGLDGGRNDCVAACVTARQMEAKSPEAIEAECREKCARDPGAYP